MQKAILRYRPETEFHTAEGCFITEISNTMDDPACSIARARVLPGATTRWHLLRDTAERYFILVGRGRVEIADLPPAEVGPGDVVLIPPRCPQRIANLGEDDLIFLAVCTPCFRPDCYEEVEPPAA